MSYEYEFRGFYPRRDLYCPVCKEELRSGDIVYTTPGHAVDGCEYCMSAETAEEEGLYEVRAEEAWM